MCPTTHLVGLETDILGMHHHPLVMVHLTNGHRYPLIFWNQLVHLLQLPLCLLLDELLVLLLLQNLLRCKNKSRIQVICWVDIWNKRCWFLIWLSNFKFWFVKETFCVAACYDENVQKLIGEWILLTVIANIWLAQDHLNKCRSDLDICSHCFPLSKLSFHSKFMALFDQGFDPLRCER